MHVMWDRFAPSTTGAGGQWASVDQRSASSSSSSGSGNVNGSGRQLENRTGGSRFRGRWHRSTMSGDRGRWVAYMTLGRHLL